MNFVPALRKWKKNSQYKYRINGDKSQEMESFLTFSIYTSKIYIKIQKTHVYKKTLDKIINKIQLFCKMKT